MKLHYPIEYPLIQAESVGSERVAPQSVGMNESYPSHRVPQQNPMKHCTLEEGHSGGDEELTHSSPFSIASHDNLIASSASSRRSFWSGNR